MPSANVARPGGETPPRSKSSSSTGSKGAEIYRAHIINVNTRDFTVDVRTEAHPYSSHYDISYMVPYVNQNQGEGINFAPEVGSTCWVCSTSDTGRDCFVLGWTTVNEGGSYRGGRELLNPGDLRFSTRDGNFLFLRRGGIVQIGATPSCQRIYIPIRNVIRDFAENYELSTPAGDLTWDVQREVDQGDGHRPALLTIACKEFADDPNKDPLATLKIGSHGDGNETILSLETRDKGGGSIKTKLEISKKGKIDWKIEDDLTLTVKGNVLVDSKKKVTIQSVMDLLIKSTTKIMIAAPGITLASAAGVLVLGGSGKLSGGSIDLGEGTNSPVVIDNGQLTAWIMAVTALLSTVPGSPAVQAVLPPLSIYKSRQVKA